MGDEIAHPLQRINDWKNKPLSEWLVRFLMYGMFANTNDEHGFQLIDHISILMTEAHQQYDQILSIPSFERQKFIDAFKKQQDENEQENTS